MEMEISFISSCLVQQTSGGWVSEHGCLNRSYAGQKRTRLDSSKQMPNRIAGLQLVT